MYADVVVLSYQPPGLDSFTYEIPKKLEGKVNVGSLVNIPFGKRSPLGLVLSTRSDLARGSARSDLDPSKIKPLTSLALDTPILLPFQIELLKWMREYYLAPMVNCAEAMLPPISSLNAKRLKTNAKDSLSPSTLDFSQTLVLVPSLNRIPETLAKFSEAKSFTTYHNQLKASEKFSLWQKIKAGEFEYIFGSRSAIFTPNPNLKKIIIFDEHDGAYKDERSPYYDTLTVTAKIAELTGSKLEIIDAAPRITTYFTHKKSISIEKPKANIRTFIVDMRKERQSQNYSPISSLLGDFLLRNYKKGGKSLIFVNKKAESGYLSCKNCEYEANMQQKPPKCPKCASSSFRFSSTSIFSIAAQIRKTVSILPKLIAAGNIFKSKFYQHSLIDIATSEIFYTQALKHYQLIADLSADTVLNTADFNSGEKLYAQIAELKKLAATRSVLVVQTNNVEKPILASTINGAYINFYNAEINQRKELAYPPYSTFVKITKKDKNRLRLEENTSHLARQLKNMGLTVLGPYSTWEQKAYRYNIILKVQKRVQQHLKEIERLARDWQIVVDPDSIN